MEDASDQSPSDIWLKAFNIVRREVDVPTVWLAMQAVRPLAVDNNRFVVALPDHMRYLAVNLETPEYMIVIQEAIEAVTGYPLALHLIEGQTLEDWAVERVKLEAIPAPVVRRASTKHVTEPPPLASTEVSSPPVVREPPVAAPPAERMPNPSAGVEYKSGSFPAYGTWDKLNEAIAHGQRAAPLMRYPRGQSMFLLKAVQMISSAMDELMDPRISDPNQERQLAKAIERLAAGLSLDPLFVALELSRHRHLTGKE